jgi:DNA invertase Pin-like site-specific DNA recombinase
MKPEKSQVKRFVALTRVSSREQQREACSLAAQEKVLKTFAHRAGGKIVRLYRIAKTVSGTGLDR